MTRVVFMGSPDFAVPSLRALTTNYDVVGVVTQPDKPAGRGRELRSPIIKQESAQLGLRIIQPAKLNEPEAMSTIEAWVPDLIVVAAFGQILRTELLGLPRHGCINVHASLLPRWRGAAPIQAAIAAGDHETGVTIMKMDAGMDTGGIISQTRIRIESTDTGGLLSDKLAHLGAELLLQTLPGYLSGELQPVPQDDSLATKAPSLKKEQGRLDSSLPADVLERRVRAYNPWPGTYLEWKGERLRVHRAHVADCDLVPGSRTVINKMPALATTKQALVLDEVQLGGRKSLNGQDFLRGARDWIA